LSFITLKHVAKQIETMAGNRRVPFPRAVDYLTDWDEDRLERANGFLKDIQLIKAKITHLEDMCEGFAD